MSSKSAFDIVHEITQKENISCVLIGGFAVNYHKVTRQTADVDFLISKDGFNKISPILEKEGYTAFSLQENFAQLQSNHAHLLDIDFIFVDQKTIANIKTEGETLKILGHTFYVPSLLHLIALKLHAIKHNPKARLSRDLPDINNLVKINEIDARDDNFKELCLEYGTQEIYEKILENFA